MNVLPVNVFPGRRAVIPRLLLRATIHVPYGWRFFVGLAVTFSLSPAAVLTHAAWLHHSHVVVH